jgi:transcriptional regulator with XRE-family HTH domain
MKANVKDLRSARRRLGYTLRDLEKKVGVSRQALSAYERAKYPPREEVWERLKTVLKLDGTVTDYWGRTAQSGKVRKYADDAECYIKGCHEHPVSMGLCRKHYQRIRYQRMTHGTSPEIEETGTAG